MLPFVAELDTSRQFHSPFLPLYGRWPRVMRAPCAHTCFLRHLPHSLYNSHSKFLPFPSLLFLSFPPTFLLFNRCDPKLAFASDLDSTRICSRTSTPTCSMPSGISSSSAQRAARILPSRAPPPSFSACSPSAGRCRFASCSTLPASVPLRQLFRQPSSHHRLRR